MNQNPNAAPTGPWQDVPFVAAPAWTVQRCPVCDAKGYVWSGLPTLTPDKCDFCNGKKAVLVSAYGTVQKII
jgi:hypothetical protein